MGLSQEDCNPCNVSYCSSIFGRVRVRPTIGHGTWIEYLLDPLISEPAPYIAQLQVGHTGVNAADDWQDVGAPAENASYLLDDEQRVFGQTQWTHYRIRLTTGTATHYSTPQHAWGDLPLRFWRLAAARERTWRIQLERAGRGQEGYLLKRRLVGEKPQPGHGITDFLTGEVLNPQAAETVGTAFLNGYYNPVPCVWAELSNVARREEIDGQGVRGTVNDGLRVPATFLAVPQLDSYDVWVDRNNDFRWEVHGIQHLEEIQGVPVVVRAELRLLPFTHPVYRIAIAGQLPA